MTLKLWNKHFAVGDCGAHQSAHLPATLRMAFQLTDICCYRQAQRICSCTGKATRTIPLAEEEWKRGSYLRVPEFVKTFSFHEKKWEDNGKRANLTCPSVRNISSSTRLLTSYLYIWVYMCVCVCVQDYVCTHIHIHNVYIYVYIMCICLCKKSSKSYSFTRIGAPDSCVFKYFSVVVQLVAWLLVSCLRSTYWLIDYRYFNTQLPLNFSILGPYVEKIQAEAEKNWKPERGESGQYVSLWRRTLRGTCGRYHPCSVKLSADKSWRVLPMSVPFITFW